MKRICHITSAHGRYDTRIFQKECRSLAKEGYEVYLLVNDKNKNEVIEKVKIISTGYLPKSRLYLHLKILKTYQVLQDKSHLVKYFPVLVQIATLHPCLSK